MIVTIRRLFSFLLCIAPMLSTATPMNTDLVHQLLDEYSVWYASLVKNNGRLPRSISGVSDDGNQFTLIVEGVNFNHVERHEFIKTILEIEKSRAFVYGSLSMTPTDEVLDIIAADSQRYIVGTWRVIRASDGRALELQYLHTNEGSDPEKIPGAWFLTNALSISKVDRLKYEDIWKHLSKDAHFRNRNVTRSK